MRTIPTNVVWSLWRHLCVGHNCGPAKTGPAKTAELIKIPFEVWAHWAQGTIHTVNRKKRGSTFESITLEKHARF